MTPVRNWIKNTLMSKFRNPGTYWSDSDEEIFEFMTGLTHDKLLRKWFEFKDGKPDFKTTGPDPRFTTCTSFLPRFAVQVCRAGNLPEQQLGPFAMPTTKGWSSELMTYIARGGPQEGDFYLTANAKGEYQHVGIIAQIEGKMWSVVGGGAGGRLSKHDGVSRSEVRPSPVGVLGFLDVDKYFEGWSGDETGGA